MNNIYFCYHNPAYRYQKKALILNDQSFFIVHWFLEIKYKR